VNLAIHFIRARNSLILSYSSGSFLFYITLLVGVVEGKKRIVGEGNLSIRLLLALMKWTARFTKLWHSKNESGHGGNPRNAKYLYRKPSWMSQEYLSI